MYKRLAIALMLLSYQQIVAAQQLPAVQFYLNTAYQCGGIGSDQAKAFSAVTKQYPLSLHFGQQYGSRVAFIADVQVVMRDENDQTVLNITSDGPICLLDIDPGRYQVFATYEGVTLHQHVDVTRQGHQVRFTWPDTEKNIQQER